MHSFFVILRGFGIVSFLLIYAASITPTVAGATPVSASPTEIQAQARSTAAIPGSLITPFALPDAQRDFNKAWDSKEQLGWRSLLILLPGEKTSLSSSTLESLRATPARLKDNVAVLIVAGNKEILQRAKAGGAPSPYLILLWDGKNLLRQQLQSRDSTMPARQTALVAIDRAGYLRQVKLLENLEQAASLLAQIGDPTPKFEVGQPAPEFTIADMNGKIRTLGEFRGRKHLLLTFFPRCFTGNCKAQLSSLRDEYTLLQANDLEVLAVSTDPADGEKGQRAYAQYLKLPFDLLSDTGRNLSILYGAANSVNQMAARQSVLIDKNGIVRWIDKQVNPTTHGADVLAKMKELGLK